MIRFQCPNCKTVMNAPDEYAGRKGSCPKCGLRLELPPPLFESVRATPLPPRVKPERKETPPPEPAIPPEPAVPPKAATPPQPADNTGWVNVNCPGCGREISLEPHELSLTIECSRCSSRFVPTGTPSPPPPAYTEKRRDERIGRAEDVERVKHIEQLEQVERVDGDEDEGGKEGGFRCPFCKSTQRPVFRTKVAAGGWVLFGVLLFLFVVLTAFGAFCLPFCFSIFLTPLCLLGLLIKEDVRVCSSCGIKLG